MKYFKFYINNFGMGYDRYSIGWWFHRAAYTVRIGDWHPIYRMWWFLQCTWPKWEYGRKLPRILDIPFKWLQSRAPKERVETIEQQMEWFDQNRRKKYPGISI